MQEGEQTSPAEPEVEEGETGSPMWLTPAPVKKLPQKFKNFVMT